MNSYSIDLSRLYAEDEIYVKGGFAEHFLIGYATSPDFRIDVSSLSVEYELDSSSLVPSTLISFRSSFLIDKLRQEGCMPVRDTSQNKSIESFNKPYAVAKRIVVLSSVSGSPSVDESKFNADIGDFMHFTLPFLDVSEDTNLFLNIIVGVLNSSLTESYTPLENWTDTKLYFDFADFKKLTPIMSDAILEQIGGFSSAGTVTVNRPPSQLNPAFGASSAGTVQVTNPILGPFLNP